MEINHFHFSDFDSLKKAEKSISLLLNSLLILSASLALPPSRSFTHRCPSPSLSATTALPPYCPSPSLSATTAALPLGRFHHHRFFFFNPFSLKELVVETTDLLQPMGKVFTLKEVADHNTPKDCWLIIDGKSTETEK